MPDRYAREALSAASDSQLIGQLERLVRADRRLTARLLAHLAEVDARKLYLQHACTSMHVYCVERLHMSDHQAYRRIQAARAARRYPRIFDMVARNQLHLAAIVLLSPVLDAGNHDDLLDAAVHKTKRQLERWLADRFPQPDAPTTLRRLPANRPCATTVPPPPLVVAGRQENVSTSTRVRDAAVEATRARPAPRSVVQPLAPARFKLQFTAGEALHDKLRAAQELLRHQLPNGDIAEIVERGLDALLAEVRRKRTGAVERPRQQKPPTRRTRHVPAAVRRAVWERDGGQCTFVDAEGNRCGSTSMLELHHIEAFVRGGAHTVENITLRCAAHNRYEAEQELGREVVAAKIREARSKRASGAPAQQTSLLAPGETRESGAVYCTAAGERESTERWLSSPRCEFTWRAQPAGTPGQPGCQNV